VAGAIIAALVLVLAVAAPLIAGDPDAQDIDDGLSEMGAPLGPRDGAPLGTDSLGRDVWSRVVGGAAVSLQVAALATLISLTIGVAIGLIAGYAGGVVDAALMRLVDLVLSFPFLLLAILLAALLREAHVGGGTAPVFITLGVVGWTTMARVVRGKVLTIRELEFVNAARAIGAGPGRILVRHLLPNVLGVVLVLAALGFAQNILAESTLSYLGLGPPPPTPTWGRMLSEGQAYYRTAPWLIVAPGVAILLTVVSFNLLGEGLRDALDPAGDRGV
jgi:ABC-type dipeptide/oligopeptide/nickel transport system permease subunit